MLRIAICIRDEQITQLLFDGAREILRSRKIKCEMSCHKEFGKVIQNLAQDRITTISGSLTERIRKDWHWQNICAAPT